MSHNITVRSNGKAEMAYRGETPWHGLGSLLPEEIQTAEGFDAALHAAGMEWKVQRSKVRYAVAQGADSASQLLTWPAQHVLFRSDTHAPLGMVSDKYKIVQPRQVLEFFRDLAATNNFTLETAGTLRGGAVYWALARIQDEGVVVKGDRVKGYVLLSTSADGSRATTAKFTSVRVVCNNTLTMADNERGRAQATVSHRSVFDAQSVKVDLGLAHGSFDRFLEQARQLAARKLRTMEAEMLTVKLLNGGELGALAEERVNEVLAGKHAQAILQRFRTGRGQELAGVKDTAWAWVNGVTEYVDHDFPARTAESRLYRAWFRGGERLKNSALALATELV